MAARAYGLNAWSLLEFSRAPQAVDRQPPPMIVQPTPPLRLVTEEELHYSTRRDSQPDESSDGLVYRNPLAENH
jgi:hypothetical protein